MLQVRDGWLTFTKVYFHNGKTHDPIVNEINVQGHSKMFLLPWQNSVFLVFFFAIFRKPADFWELRIYWSKKRCLKNSGQLFQHVRSLLNFNSNWASTLCEFPHLETTLTTNKCNKHSLFYNFFNWLCEIKEKRLFFFLALFFFHVPVCFCYLLH